MGFDLSLWRNLCISYLYRMDLPCNERTFSAKSRRKYSVIDAERWIYDLCHLLSFWKDTSFIRISVVIQCILLAVILHMGVNGSDRIQAIQGIQAGREAGSGQKAEIAAYCGKHKENYYILDTQSFGKPSGVKDDLHQGNWYMSGSWTAYSPLYEEKLAKDGISNLGTGFLLKKNVYIITKGKKNILNLLGQEDTEHLTYKAVDEIEASGNLFFAVYKVSRSVK